MSLQQLLLAIRTGDVNSAWEVFNSSSNLQNLLDSSDTWDGMTALHWASVYGQLELLQILLQYGAEVDKMDINGRTALHVAVTSMGAETLGSLDAIVQLLVEYGAPIDALNKQGQTALQCAAAKGRASVVTVLVEHGALVQLPLDDRWEQSAQDQGGRSHLVTLHLLLQHGADIDMPTQNGSFRLFGAAERRSVMELDILLRRGAHINHQTRQGHTALHKVVECGNIDATRLLLDKGASVSLSVFESRLTPLHIAASHGNASMINLLLAHSTASSSDGALSPIVDLQTSKGETALHLAVTEMNAEAVKSLLEHNARTDLLNAKERTVWDEAARLTRTSFGRRVFALLSSSRVNSSA